MRASYDREMRERAKRTGKGLTLIHVEYPTRQTLLAAGPADKNETRIATEAAKFCSGNRENGIDRAIEALWAVTDERRRCKRKGPLDCVALTEDRHDWCLHCLAHDALHRLDPECQR